MKESYLDNQCLDLLCEHLRFLLILPRQGRALWSQGTIEYAVVCIVQLSNTILKCKYSSIGKVIHLKHFYAKCNMSPVLCHTLPTQHKNNTNNYAILYITWAWFPIQHLACNSWLHLWVHILQSSAGPVIMPVWHDLSGYGALPQPTSSAGTSGSLSHSLLSWTGSSSHT